MKKTQSLWKQNTIIKHARLCEEMMGFHLRQSTVRSSRNITLRITDSAAVNHYHTVKSTVRRMTTRLFTYYFRFQNTCNRNNLYGFLVKFQDFIITKSCKECHWTPFYPPNTLRGRECHFSVVRMFLCEFYLKQRADTSKHRGTHPVVTKMTIVNFLVNVLQHNFNKQF